MGKAELKISAILIYYTVIAVIGFVGQTYAIKNRELIEQDIAEYLACIVQETVKTTCSQFIAGRLGGLYILSDISTIMLANLPVVYLFFGMDFKVCQKMWRKLHTTQHSQKELVGIQSN